MEFWGFHYCSNRWCDRHPDGCGFYCWKSSTDSSITSWTEIMALPTDQKKEKACERTGGTVRQVGWAQSPHSAYKFCCDTEGSAWNPALVSVGWSYYGGVQGKDGTFCRTGFSTT